MDVATQDAVQAAVALRQQLARSRRRLFQVAEGRLVDTQILARKTQALAQSVEALAAEAATCWSQFPELATVAASGLRSPISGTHYHLTEDGGSLRISTRSRQQFGDGLARVRALVLEARGRRFGKSRLLEEAVDRAGACQALLAELRRAAKDAGAPQQEIDRRSAAQRQAILAETVTALSHAQVAIDLALADGGYPQRPWNDPRWDGCGIAGEVMDGPFYAGSLRPKRDPALGPDAAVGTDLLVPLFLELEGHLRIRYDAARRPEALSMLESLLVRRLVTAPPGRVQFHVYDPVGLGASLPELLPLVDFNAELLGGKVWSGPDELRDLLTRTTAHLEVVVQKYLRTEFEDIRAFNRAAGELAEPIRYVVLLDFPTGVSADSARELKRIAENGARCGVHLLLGENTSRVEPEFVQALHSVAEMRAVDLGAPFIADVDGYSLNLDLQPEALGSGTRILETLLPQIAKTSRLGADNVIPLDRVLSFYRDAVTLGLYPRRQEDSTVPSMVDPNSWWHRSSSGGLSAPIGQRGAREAAILTFDSGDHPGALLVGRPGSGKSTLLHVYLAGLAMQYHPDELELYLVDFKEGVEFKAYAAEALPHARCVAIESDREFGLSVLQSLVAEIARRGERLRSTDGHYVGLERLRESTGEQMARVLLVFDEFHVLFARNDKVGLAAAELLEQVIRQGRSFGIHVLLASQSLSGLDALGSHVPQLLPVRILLPASDADGRRVLGEANGAGQYLTTKGEGILNTAGGANEANERFRGALLDDEGRHRLLRSLRFKANEAGIMRQPVIFDGRALVPLSQFDPRAFSEETRATGTAPLRIRVGLPMSVHGAADVELRRESGANVLLVARSEMSALAVTDRGGVPVAQLIGMLASLAATEATVYVVDFLSVDEDIEATLGPLGTAKRVTLIRSRQFPETVRRLANLIAGRIESDDVRAAPVVLALYGLHRARALDASDLDLDQECGQLLERLLRDGPEVGVHTWAWADSLGGTTRRLGSAALREFSWRIAGKMSAEDSQRLLDSDVAAALRSTQLVIVNDDLGVEQRAMALGPPEAAWLDELVSL